MTQRSWEDICALAPRWLDAALFEVGAAPPEVVHLGRVEGGPTYGVTMKDSMRITAWWSPTEHWSDCMDVVWQYRLSLISYNDHAICLSGDGTIEAGVRTESEARLALARLALWTAQQKGT